MIVEELPFVSHADVSAVDLTAAPLGSEPYGLPVIVCPGCGRRGDSSGQGLQQAVMHRAVRVTEHVQAATDFCYREADTGAWVNSHACATEALAGIGISMIPPHPGRN